MGYIIVAPRIRPNKLLIFLFDDDLDPGLLLLLFVVVVVELHDFPEPLLHRFGLPVTLRK